MENNQSSLADRSWGILARSIFYPFREIEFSAACLAANRRLSVAINPTAFQAVDFSP